MKFLKLTKISLIILSFTSLHFRFIECVLSIEVSLDIASSAFDALCTQTISLHNALKDQSPDISQMNFQLMTSCKNYSVRFEEADKLIHIKGISRSKRFVFFAPGWRNTIENSKSIVEMAEAFDCRDDVNFVAVDFASYMDTNYKWAAINTKEVGAAIAVGLTKLVKFVPISNIHLVGHSLGAHIMGAAGRVFKSLNKGRLLPRITGLDPAKPCFGNDEKLSSLSQSDARLLDIIHTNSGVLGIREAIGDIDFYPAGLTIKQPGCLSVDCAHSRAVAYFIESIYPRNEQNFNSHQCPTWQALVLGNCAKINANVYMGFKLNRVKPGIFQVDVNNQSPYGRQGLFAAIAKQNCQRKRLSMCKRK